MTVLANICPARCRAFIAIASRSFGDRANSFSSARAIGPGLPAGTSQPVSSFTTISGDGPLTVMSLITILFKILFNPWVFFGLFTFVISMMSHLYVLSKVELSFVYPFLSLAFVAVAVGSWVFFAEDINALRIVGIGFICIGTVLIAQGGSSDSASQHNANSAATPASPQFMGSKS